MRTKEEGTSCQISASGGVENYVERIKKSNMKKKNTLKNSLLSLFVLLSINVFSQKIFVNKDYEPEKSRYRIYYKTDKETNIKVYMRMFMIENEKFREDHFKRCDVVTLFLKRDNPWLAKDFKTRSTCIGWQLTDIEFIKITSDRNFLYVVVSYFGYRMSEYIFVFEKDEEGLYHLVRQQVRGFDGYEEKKSVGMKSKALWVWYMCKK
jgi:hypothetical protein